MSEILKAVRSRDLGLVLKAIANGADLNEISTRGGQTALTLACEAGHLEITKALLDAGADPNLPGEMGYTPLMCAVAFNNESEDSLGISQLLLAHGADIDARNDDGETAIEVLLYAPGNNPRPEIAELLIKEMLRVSPSRDLAPLAFLIIEFGHLHTLKLLVRNGLDLETKDRFGYTLLHSACRRHAVDKVDFLLNQGADFNFQPRLGWSDHPFDLACRFNRIDWLEFLRNGGFRFDRNPQVTSQRPSRILCSLKPA